MKMFRYLFIIISATLFISQLLAQQKNQKNNETSENVQMPVKLSLEELQQDYHKKISELSARIKELEKEKQQTELEELLEEARKLASQKETKEKEKRSKTFTSGQRQQQSLNPNISVTGDFIGYMSNIEEDKVIYQTSFIGNKFVLREAEFHIISNLDPYTRAKFFLGVPGLGSLHVGETYMEWLNLPLNAGLKIGKFRNQFGLLNRWHEHSLPQVDRPKVLTQFFGEEGLRGVGAGANLLLPKLWANVNELDLELIYGGDGVSFTNEGKDQWVAVGHLKNYFDLTSNAYLEVGLSGAYGSHDKMGELQTLLGGVDITYRWVPKGRSKYRTVEFRNELLLSNRQESTGEINSLGFYSYIANKLGARWWIGLRFDQSQTPFDNKEYLWGITPFLTFWQSEFVFIRFQFSHNEYTYGDNENVFIIQSVWSVGPHKHEAY